MSLSKCTTAGGCSKTQKAITLDANWRWTHEVGNSTNCFTGNEWNKADCTDPDVCAQKCALDGVDDAAW